MAPYRTRLRRARVVRERLRLHSVFLGALRTGKKGKIFKSRKELKEF
jgi:hypothetical protein